jgi:hypothetical protein
LHGWSAAIRPAYRSRNAIERMFRRLGIGTRYDRLATRFLADLGIAAAVSYWLGVLTLERASNQAFHCGTALAKVPRCVVLPVDIASTRSFPLPMAR